MSAGGHILVVSHSPSLGGSQRSLIEHVRTLKEGGLSVTAIVPDAGDVESALTACGVPVYRTQVTRWTAPVSARFGSFPTTTTQHLRAARLIEEIIRAQDVNLVLTNTITTPVGALAARLAHRPHIWRVSEFGWSDQGLAFQYGERQSRDWMARNSAALIAVSNAVKSDLILKSSAHPPVHVVYPQVDVHPQPNHPQTKRGQKLTICQVGRLAPGKGLEVAVRAVASCARGGLPIDLIIAGSGNVIYVDDLKALISSEGIAGSVHFAGQLDDTTSIYRRSDLAVLCSQREAFGRVVVEAMRNALPVFATRAGAIPEVIHDGLNGRTFPVGDHEALASLLSVADADREGLAAMGARAKTMAIKYFNGARSSARLIRVVKELACGSE